MRDEGSYEALENDGMGPVSRDVRRLTEFKARQSRMLESCPGFFDRHPLRAMRRLRDGRYQFGYEIGGYGTVVGHCVVHSHKTEAGAEECGRRFLAGLPPRRWRRK